MKNIYPLIISLLIIQIGAQAQGLRGRVIDQDGKPLPFTTIFVQQTGSGSISNDKGVYELKLSPGSYLISFQYLGYASSQVNVEITDGTKEMDIVLQEQAYLLGEAEIKGGKEDPAYPIMRKAIAKSGYHRQQLDAYTCKVYLKGGGRLVDAPWFLRKMLEKEGIDTSATFVTESVSEISFTRPGNYEEKVISIRTSGDDRNTNPMNYINGSLYEKELGGIISPFSPKAFAYYKFKYLSTFNDRGHQINKIEVNPRSAGEDVVRGVLYIVEDLWCIHSVDLSLVVQGITVSIDQVYAPIIETVWMPVSHRFGARGKIMGFEFEGQYLATVSNYKVTLNPDLSTEFTVLDEKTEKEAIKEREKKPLLSIDEQVGEEEAKLMKGEELTRKELRKLMRNYEKDERKEKDEPTIMSTRSVKIDSTAYDSDSLYWADIRPLPLTESEQRGYVLQDSIAIEQKKKMEGDTLSNGKGFKISDLVLGNRYDLGKQNYIEIKNPLLSPRFNVVDGWNFEYQLSYFKRFSPTKRLEIRPLYRYAFAREKNMGTLLTEYKYGTAIKSGKISLSGGYYYSQFNDNVPIATFTNMISSLFVENHFMRVYDRNFVEAKWNQQVTPNFYIEPKVSYNDRIETFNSTKQVWIPNDMRSYEENAPVSIERPVTTFGQSQSFISQLGLSYRPGGRFNKSGINYYRANNPPTLSLTYTKAIPDVLGSDAKFDLVRFEYKDQFDLNLLGKINLRTEVGKFLNTSNMDFMDFAHFMGNETVFTRFAQMQGYSIAPYYDFSTQDEYWSTYVNYEFRQFLLTNIRILRLTGVKENININHLLTPSVNNYTELSYSIDNLFRFFRIDVTQAFLDGKPADFRVQLGITTDLVSFGN